MIFLQVNFYLFLYFSCLFKRYQTIQCYVCHNQETNIGKCTETRIQCPNRSHNTCKSVIQMKKVDYWNIESRYQYVISKSCDTAANCKRLRNVHYEGYDPETQSSVEKCHRSKFSNWTCIECCEGPSCNHYVTLGASKENLSMLIFITTAFLSIISLFATTF